MDKISIERADINSLQDIVSLEKGFKEDRYSAELIASSLNNKNAINLIAKLDNMTIGYLSASKILDEAELLKIIVEDNYRKLGCGYKLLEELFIILNYEGVSKIFLEVRKDNIPAKKLYEKIGFSKISERKEYYNDGVDAEIYWYDLNAKN